MNLKLADPVKNMKWAKYSIGDVTQWFGENPALYQKYMNGIQAHNGVDIVRPHGTHMFAVEDGVIAKIKVQDTGHGRYVKLLSKKDDDGTMREWIYAHMSWIGVKDGQEVKKGQFVGTMGNTGFVVSGDTVYWVSGSNGYGGTHLHLGVRDAVDDRRGFKYTGYGNTVRILNYENGYKGRYDPVPLFLPPELKSSKIISFASEHQNLVFFQAGQIMKQIGL